MDIREAAQATAGKIRDRFNELMGMGDLPEEGKYRAEAVPFDQAKETYAEAWKTARREWTPEKEQQFENMFGDCGALAVAELGPSDDFPVMDDDDFQEVVENLKDAVLAARSDKSVKVPISVVTAPSGTKAKNGKPLEGYAFVGLVPAAFGVPGRTGGKKPAGPDPDPGPEPGPKPNPDPNPGPEPEPCGEPLDRIIEVHNLALDALQGQDFLKGKSKIGKILCVTQDTAMNFIVGETKMEALGRRLLKYDESIMIEIIGDHPPKAMIKELDAVLEDAGIGMDEESYASIPIKKPYPSKTGKGEVRTMVFLGSRTPTKREFERSLQVAGIERADSPEPPEPAEPPYPDYSDFHEPKPGPKPGPEPGPKPDPGRKPARKHMFWYGKKRKSGKARQEKAKLALAGVYSKDGAFSGRIKDALAVVSTASEASDWYWDRYKKNLCGSLNRLHDAFKRNDAALELLVRNNAMSKAQAVEELKRLLFGKYADELGGIGKKSFFHVKVFRNGPRGQVLKDCDAYVVPLTMRQRKILPDRPL